MADNKAEKKDIASLDFTIVDAKKKLEEINSLLQNLATNSKDVTNQISNNLNKAISGNSFININSVNKDLNEATKLSKSKMDQLVVQSEKIRLRSEAKQTEIVLQEEQKRETAAYKSALKQEENNNRVLKSTQTLYDKISEYAKTYIIYQGFNQMRQAIGEVIEEMVDLESQMIQIDRVLNENTLNIDKYRDKLLNLASEYGNAMDNVTDIALRLAQAGYNSNEVIALTEKTLLALNTAELNATQATDDMVAVMAQWGLMTGTATEQAKQYGDIIDKINIVADNYPTTSADIMDALKKVSSAFNLAGASIDETIATITAAEIASQRGGKAIGTALSNITQQLKDAGRLNIAESLGLDFYTDSTKKEFKGIIEIFQEMSDKMQELKNAGKENSVEMQNLLSIFTVFRRNIGASLLSEMGGEVSKYDEIMKTLSESTGYSLQENEKYLKTVKAQQEQFNATLLKLKTEVWDGGVEDVYKGILSLGNDIVKNIQLIVKTFGAVPTAVGLAVAALTLLNKEMRLYRTVSVTMSDGTKTNIKMLNDWVLKLRTAFTEVKTLDNGQKQIVTSFSAFIKNLKGLATAEGQAAAQTVILEAKTIALQAAYSLGLSLAITLVLKAFDNLVHAEEKQIEKYNDIIDKSSEEVDKLEQENEQIEGLISNYEKLQKTQGSNEDISKSQESITDYLIKQNQYTKEMVNNYDLQIQKLKEIQKANRDKALADAKNALGTAQELNKGKGLWGQFWSDDLFSTKGKTLSNAGLDFSKLQELSGFGKIGSSSVMGALEGLDLDKQLEVLKDFEQQLETTKQYGTEAWTLVENKISDVEEKTTKLTEAQKEYNNQLLENTLQDTIKPENIKNIDDYRTALESINNIEPSDEWTGSVEDFRASLTALLQNEFPEFKQQATESSETIVNYTSSITELSTKLEDLQNKYTILTTAQNELNQSGEITVSTFKNLVDNNLLDYLDVVNGKLVISEGAFIDQANAAKQQAIANLQAETASEILSIAQADLAQKTKSAETAANNAKGDIKEVGNAALEAAKKAVVGATSFEGFTKAMEGATDINWSSLSDNAVSAINSSLSKLDRLTTKINSISLTRASSSSRGSSRSSSSAKAAAERAAEQAQKEAEEAAKAAKKAEEEAYKKRLSEFEDYITEKERLEKRWVDKQKDLGLLSNNDYLYITQQRIERYKKYLEEVRKATWMNAEDRLKLEKEYSEKIEDLQVDYLGYLQDQLNDEIKALEDANDKKIELIKNEADERINALKKVESENDRIRSKEEYEKKRQEHLDDISYWEQRTGREAQESLKEAKKNLAELDEEWKQTKEDWSIEDQIQQIEDERDAEVKAIEEAQKKEIESLQAVYDAKVKLFAETGEIIYEGSVIQAQSLYNAYKKNFIDPITSDLENLNKVQTSAPTPDTNNEQGATAEQQYETYTIKRGDTLSRIARNYGTTVDKLMEANPYITNKNRIYAGKTLQIPKFHEGGIFGGLNEEGLALLKKGEVILKPSWSESLNRMMKYFDSVSSGNTTNISNGPSITVKGDLIKVEASVRNQSDIDNIGKKVEKILKDKFNIKK